MKKPIIASVIAAGLLMGAGSTVAASDDGPKSAPPESAFSPLQRYDISYDERRELGKFYLREFGINHYDADFTELAHPEDADMRVMLVTVDGLEDAAVKGIQIRLGLRSSGGSWQAVEAGVRRKCARGESVGQWTRDVCP